MGVAQVADKGIKGCGFHAADAGRADLLLVRQHADGGLTRGAQGQEGRQAGEAAHPVIVAVGADQGAVEADVGGLEGGHHLQLGGDEILLHDVVLLVQVVHDGQLYPVGALVVLKGAAADKQVQAFAGDGLAQGLLGLLHAQVG